MRVLNPSEKARGWFVYSVYPGSSRLNGFQVLTDLNETFLTLGFLKLRAIRFDHRI